MDLYSPPVNSKLRIEVPSGSVFSICKLQGENITSKSDICSQTREVPNGRVSLPVNSRRRIEVDSAESIGSFSENTGSKWTCILRR